MCFLTQFSVKRLKSEIYEGIFVNNFLDGNQIYKHIDFYGNAFEGTLKYGEQIFSDDFERLYCEQLWDQATIPEDFLNKTHNHKTVKMLKQKKYVGSFKNHNFHGKGTLIYKCGSIFTGYFEYGYRCSGEMRYANGDKISSCRFKEDFLKY